jgi:antitoxin HicB
MLAYPVDLERDGDMVIAVIPDIPGAHTFGVSEADALAHCVGAIEEMLAARMCDREAIPLPSIANGRPVVEVSPLSALKVSLYGIMWERQLRKSDLARLLNVNQKQVDRLLDLNHASRLDQLQAAFRVLGKRIAIQVADDDVPVAA